MKVSLHWLKSWVDSDWDANTTAEQITMAGLEVDGIIPAAGNFNDVIVAEVTATSPHPDADKLTLCQVNTGKGEVDIVCGAHNVRAGLKVALAQVGAVLPNGLKIKPAKLRGQPSQGMLCSATELGMADQSEGILELPDDAPVGENLRTYLALDDTTLDIDLTPNRADCFSIRGVAREVAALARRSVNPLPSVTIPIKSRLKRSIHLNAGLACGRFCGRVIENINPNAVTPLWMQERLRRCGLRTIHPVVDITNYVMMELGQPMHAYDNDKLQGAMQVRFANDGESLLLLDDKEISLSPDALVIADEKQSLSLAGVMGGAQSSVTVDTHAIFLESAFFNPKHIAGIARRYGLCTDSSQRFERGIDPSIQTVAIDYASELILSICGGDAGELTVAENLADLPQQALIQFNPAKVKQLTGVDIAEAEIEKMLQALGLDIDSKSTPWRVKAPSYRFDMNLDVDLVEEVIRLYGFQHIVGSPMEGEIVHGSIDAIEVLNDKIANGLVLRGYQETVTYSFVDPQVQKAFYPEEETMDLLNPLSSEMSQMRLGLWPGLVASMLHNLHRQHTSMHLFESGVIFDYSKGKIIEKPMIAGLALGQRGAINWCDDVSKIDFYDIKGDVQALCRFIGLNNIQLKASTHPALHPGQSADIYVQQKWVGRMGQLHPRLAAALDISQTVFLFELCLSALATFSPKPAYRSFSKFPLIRRDLALLVDEATEFEQIKRLVEKAVGNELLRSVDVFDRYLGESIPKGRKSLAISVAMQAADKTLTDIEINNKISAILKILQQELSIELRES
ncbi:phenylalanine--tRNA ligase subunit beta [Legionella sp. W05-934-2]|jgi:phenylalanyl-tRNA synthetase beta chain|uniref:phenylalanine--tRNA ligase subunit beta n=1 Tax=Legionella sp. W05-934-2 TaxID=1198649 RepID=UPI003463476F